MGEPLEITVRAGSVNLDRLPQRFNLTAALLTESGHRFPPFGRRGIRRISSANMLSGSSAVLRTREPIGQGDAVNNHRESGHEQAGTGCRRRRKKLHKQSGRRRYAPTAQSRRP